MVQLCNFIMKKIKKHKEITYLMAITHKSLVVAIVYLQINNRKLQEPSLITLVLFVSHNPCCGINAIICIY